MLKKIHFRFDIHCIVLAVPTYMHVWYTHIFLIEWRQSRIVRFESEMWIASDLLPYTLIQYSTWFDPYLNNFVIRALWINMVQKPSISTLVLWTKIFHLNHVLLRGKWWPRTSVNLFSPWEWKYHFFPLKEMKMPHLYEL